MLENRGRIMEKKNIRTNNLSLWIKKIEEKRKRYWKKREEIIKTWVEESWQKNQRKVNSLNNIFPNHFYKNFMISNATKKMPDSYGLFFDLYQELIPEKIEKEYVELSALLSDYYQYINYLDANTTQLNKESDHLLKQSDPEQNKKTQEKFLFHSKEIEKICIKIHETIAKISSKIDHINQLKQNGSNLDQVEISEKQLKSLETIGLPQDLLCMSKQYIMAYIKMRLNCFKEVEKEANLAISFYRHHSLLPYQTTANLVLNEYNQAKYYKVEKEMDEAAMEAEEYALKFDFSKKGLRNATRSFYAFLNLTPKCVTIESCDGMYDYYDYQSKDQQKKILIQKTIMEIISEYLETGTIAPNNMEVIYQMRDYIRKSSFDYMLEPLERYEIIEEQKEMQPENLKRTKIG